MYNYTTNVQIYNTYFKYKTYFKKSIGDLNIRMLLTSDVLVNILMSIRVSGDF